MSFGYSLYPCPPSKQTYYVCSFSFISWLLAVIFVTLPILTVLANGSSSSAKGRELRPDRNCQRAPSKCLFIGSTQERAANSNTGEVYKTTWKTVSNAWIACMINNRPILLNWEENLDSPVTWADIPQCQPRNLKWERGGFNAPWQGVKVSRLCMKVSLLQEI